MGTVWPRLNVIKLRRKQKTLSSCPKDSYGEPVEGQMFFRFRLLKGLRQAQTDNGIVLNLMTLGLGSPPPKGSFFLASKRPA